MKKYYNVSFSYSLNVEAKNKTEAEEKACEEFYDIMPKPYEMGVKVKEIEKPDYLE